jgi:hypothetical protein
VGVNFLNPSKFGGEATSPSFQLFQNEINEIDPNSRIYFWFGGNRESSNLQSPPFQFLYWDGRFSFVIEKMYVYHGAIINVADVDFNLIEVSSSTSTLLGTLSGTLPAQLSSFQPNVQLDGGNQYQIEIMNNQLERTFIPYQITAICRRV